VSTGQGGTYDTIPRALACSRCGRDELAAMEPAGERREYMVTLPGFGFAIPPQWSPPVDGGSMFMDGYLFRRAPLRLVAHRSDVDFGDDVFPPFTGGPIAAPQGSSHKRAIVRRAGRGLPNGRFPSQNPSKKSTETR
jgi:hypothetical protein